MFEAVHSRHNTGESGSSDDDYYYGCCDDNDSDDNPDKSVP